MQFLDLFHSKRIPSARLCKHARTPVYGIVHFSMNTFSGKEWGFGDEKPESFNPREFDAAQIVHACKNGGLEGLILVCKHHDGFCLWPTATTAHNLTKSPFRDGKGDLVREFSDACRKEGVKFGVYVSPWDRNSAFYGTPEYVNIFHAQLRELLTGYGSIFEVWFDGANGGDGYYGGARERRKIDPSSYYQWEKTYSIVRELQPDACIFGDAGPELRWAGNERGLLAPDCRCSITPEVSPDSAGIPIPCPGNVVTEVLDKGQLEGQYFIQPECDFPLRPGWFWHDDPQQHPKSAKELMGIYLHSVGCGGTMNIGIAPDRRGLLPDEDCGALRAFRQLRESMEAGCVFKTEFVPETESRVLEFGEEKTVQLIRMTEDVSDGEMITGYRLELRRNGVWSELLTGTAIGFCRIRRLDHSPSGDAVRLAITSSRGTVRNVSIELFRIPEDLFPADDVSGGVDENYQRLKPADDAEMLFTLPAPAKFGLVIFTPDPIGKKNPTHCTVELSGDGKTFHTVLQNFEMSNITANPIPQEIRFEPESAVMLRFKTFRDGAPYTPEPGRFELGIVPEKVE